MAKVASSGAMIFLSTEAAPMAPQPQPFNRRGSCTKIAIDHEGLPQGLKYFCLHVPDVHQLAPASSSNARLKQH
jgi:membrane-bound ClpP family serine protease